MTLSTDYSHTTPPGIMDNGTTRLRADSNSWQIQSDTPLYAGAFLSKQALLVERLMVFHSVHPKVIAI